MKSRPFFNKSIRDLENIHRDNLGDVQIRKELLHELEFRSTARASNLKSQIIDQVTPPQPHQASKPKTSVPPSNEAPPEAPLPHFSPSPKPPITNETQNILSAWTALEVLSPQGYQRETELVGGNRSRIANIDNSPLPWKMGEKSLPKKRLYYELILGTINLGPAVEALLKLYSDNRPDMPRINRRSPIASILLDKKGRPLEEETSFAISSFAWGVPIALQGDLKLLAQWPTKEREFKKAFRKELIQRDTKGEVLPLSKERIANLYSILVSALHLKGHDVAPPHFAIRRYEYFASKASPEPSLLNSFFLDDLTNARHLAASSKLPGTLKFYLGEALPNTRTDLLENQAGLRTLLQPSSTPLGRWPSPGRFPLALLQQAAVNGTTGGLKETGILSVNGPPGTGKTTLLRDIVAARIIERAALMVEYKNPENAFSPTDQIFQRSGAKITLHRLDDRLKGFEMVVASFNNKAVENVSAELPTLDAIASDAKELRYFSSISDKVLKRETWGMIAAVLGKSSNRFEFSKNFWRDDEHGFSTYLNHVAGVPQYVMEPQEDGPPTKRPRSVVSAEKPPNSLREARAKWDKARALFLEKTRVAQDTQAKLQKVHDALIKAGNLADNILKLKASIPSLDLSIQDTELQKDHLLGEVRESNVKHGNIFDALSNHERIKPSIFSQLFRTKTATNWRSERKKVSAQLCDCEAELKNKQKNSIIWKGI